MPRTIAIGDVHGCRAELEDLLSKLSPRADDRLIFLGDLVNRGPDSLGVLALVASLKNTTVLMGNHELRLLATRSKNPVVKVKPGDKTLAATLPPQAWRMMENMPLTLFNTDLQTIFVHGGFLPDVAWQTQPAEVVTRIQAITPDGRPCKRSECPNCPLWADLWPHPTFVIYGHTPRTTVYARPTSLCIDTGCVYGGALTAYILPEGKIVQVPARQSYAS